MYNTVRDDAWEHRPQPCTELDNEDFNVSVTECGKSYKSYFQLLL